MFDRCFLINLKRRPDRLTNFRNLQETYGWELPEPMIFEAIEGDKVGVPGYFKQGGGAYGCLRSHVNCLERCVMDGVDTVLMLEDDVTWQADAWPRLRQFITNVPNNWSQLMLGGQHLQPSHDIGIKGLVKCANTQRTHAYVAKGAAIKSLLGLWYTCEVHIDWRMGDWQKDWQVYAPDPFIFGQAGGVSDISGRTNPAYIWSDVKQPLCRTHVLVLRSPRKVLDNLHGFHRGYWLHSSGLDNGLIEVSIAPNKIEKLTEWIRMISDECVGIGSVPTIWHPGISCEEVKQACPHRTVIEITAITADELNAKWKEATEAT